MSNGKIILQPVEQLVNGHSQLEYSPYFSETFYKYLPEKLSEICDLIPATEPYKKDVLIIGIITALSAAASKNHFIHGSETDILEYSPHLLSLIIAEAGAGKNLMRYGYLMVQLLAEEAIKKQNTLRKKFEFEYALYQKEFRKRTRSGASVEDLEQPKEPWMVQFVAGASDTSQAGLVAALRHNPMGIFGYDTEVDTMTDANSKDFGDFGTVLRKAFGHEPLPRQRQGKGESYIVEKPRLAVLFSGTHGQLKKLMKSEENGLFSRFLYYTIPPKFIKYKQMTNTKDIIGERCIALQKHVFDMFTFFEKDVVHFEFTKDQEDELERNMADKEAAEKKWSHGISASWLRLATIIKRIAVTLAAFDGIGGGVMPDQYWKCAIAALPTLKYHCIQSLHIIRERTKGRIDISKERYEELKAKGKNDTEIAEEFEVDKSLISRRRQEWYGK